MNTKYKTNPNYSLQKISDTFIIVPISESCPKFNGMMKITGIGPYLWDFFIDGATVEEACNTVIKKYGVSQEEAHKDISDFVVSLYENGLILKV